MLLRGRGVIKFEKEITTREFDILSNLKNMFKTENGITEKRKP
jgi:hypothetical protein